MNALPVVGAPTNDANGTAIIAPVEMSYDR